MGKQRDACMILGLREINFQTIRNIHNPKNENLVCYLKWEGERNQNNNNKKNLPIIIWM